MVILLRFFSLCLTWRSAAPRSGDGSSGGLGRAAGLGTSRSNSDHSLKRGPTIMVPEKDRIRFSLLIPFPRARQFPRKRSARPINTIVPS